MTSETSQSEVDRAAPEHADEEHADKEQASSGQVDFYLLADANLSADHLACRLAMMAWERHQQVFVVGRDAEHLDKLDELMWQYPPDRFLPHARVTDQHAQKAPVKMGLGADLKAAGVVINLCPEAIPQADRFDRILEIVPFVKEQRDASRAKYKTYSQLGLQPQTHEIT